MPATEQTWRDQTKLHFLFAITGTVLFIATVWMFLKDHNRQWKDYQRTADEIQTTADQWREKHVETAAAQREHEELQSQLLTAQAAPIDPQLHAAFKQEVDRDLKLRGEEAYDFSSLDKKYETLREQATAAATARAEAERLRAAADQAETSAATALVEQDSAERALKAAATPDAKAAAKLEVAAKTERRDDLIKAAAEARQRALDGNEQALAAEQTAAQTRSDLLSSLNAFAKSAKFREDNLLGARKFQNANLDKAKADEGLIVRDYSDPKQAAELEAKLGAQEAVIHEVDQRVADLTLSYQAAAEHRKALQGNIKQITADADGIKKQIELNRAELVRLEKAIAERRSTYVVWWNGLPTPGKKLLEGPILDAFNSPLKIENLWSDGLTIDYNFQQVKRYDRCTTCHQMMEKSQPGAADKPAFVKERFLTVILTPPPAEQLAQWQAEAKKTETPLTVEQVFGIAIGPDGLAERNAVSVTNVVDGSLGAQARLLPSAAATTPITGDEIRNALLKTATAHEPRVELEDPHNPFPATPGLYVGDIFVDVDGTLVRTQAEAQRFLLDGATSQKPVHIRVRRGMPNPYTSHPRLDLFIGSLSPHTMQEFACTICHEGQGSATDFKWASHTPDTVDQGKRWSREYGWFDNHHWIYPMNATRFAESSCLKCHHDVVDLEPSERFPEAPAPKVVHGYNLIRKYGCYGCHEINGYDGPDRRIGPDLRLEPNYFAAAQQLKTDPNFDKLTGEERGWVETVIAHPERAEERSRLFELLQTDQGEDARLTAMAHSLAPLFKGVDAAGELRKVGPSLRYADTKLDETFLMDWIANPKNFRPSTRMPQVFGLTKHLQDSPAALAVAEKYEPLEIQGIATYIQTQSQAFEHLEPPAEVTATASAERGKVQFQTRGCLACHSHGEFSDAEAFRDAQEIVQGPDLSGLAQKFDEQRNPQGRKWLYSWIKEPTRYHARTVMPNLYLDPIEVTVDGQAQVTDPVADIVEYLLSSTTGKPWQPVHPQPAQHDESEATALSELLFEHLKDAFAVRVAAKYAGGALDEEGQFVPSGDVPAGIPADRGAELKGAERDLLVASGARLSEEQKLNYIGRKSISKYGCYGCHDIPGYEDAKPIGAGLNDWGRKEPAKLAFEHIAQYLEHGHGHGGQGGHAQTPVEKRPDAPPVQSDAVNVVDHAAHGHAPGEHAEQEPAVPDFFMEQLLHGNRIGFLYQKLREPRSYDYHKAEHKKYNDRLRMPLFPFNDTDREAVMTFVLGLVAAPPANKYVYHADARNQALVEGRKVLEKYNCQSCHVLQAEQWSMAFPADHFANSALTDDIRSETFPFLIPHATPEMLKASTRNNRQGLHTANLNLMPRLNADGRPLVNDDEGEDLDPEAKYDPSKMIVYFDLWQPTVLSGKSFMSGVGMNAPVSMIDQRNPAHGGFLTRYLLPVVTQIDAAETNTAKGSEAMGWLPPPLTGEGRKVQSSWLHEFLLEPYPIRPAVFMRMPKFNMSKDEATKLAAYFAAVDNADYPYTFNDRRQESFLQKVESEYQARLARNNTEGTRFDDAMKIVTSNNYCVKCHIVGNFSPGMGAEVQPSPRAMAPDLARVYQRFRPDYLREWIANPKSKLPYTSMPVNIPYNANAEFKGGVAQELYHGDSIEQVDALVDLLMNFDQYAKRQTDIAKNVKPAEAEAPADAPAETPAETTPAAETGGE